MILFFFRGEIFGPLALWLICFSILVPLALVRWGYARQTDIFRKQTYCGIYERHGLRCGLCWIFFVLKSSLLYIVRQLGNIFLGLVG